MAYHSITCTEDACDPGVDGGQACPFYRRPVEDGSPACTEGQPSSL